MVRQKNGAEWTMIEIFLNKLENSEALYKELAAKLNDERVTDSDGLTGHLLRLHMHDLGCLVCN